MKTSYILSLIPLLFIAFFNGCEPGADSNDETVVDHRKSPIVISAVNHDDTYLKIVYGQPYKRGRDVFGGLEPYGEVWRTGANEATEITITRDIEMAGHRVEAGTYALFTIPDRDQWTVILNTNLGQWGAFTYSSLSDYLRFDVPAMETDEIIEALTITFDEVQNDSTRLHIAWDDTRIEIPVVFL